MKVCRTVSAALGPYSYPLVVAAENEGLKEGRKKGMLTDTPAPSPVNHVDGPAPAYADVDPLTGTAIPTATSAPSFSPAPSFLPTLALYISGLAFPALLCVIVGVLAKAACRQ